MKNVVVVEYETIEAPQAIVECVHEFVQSIREEQAELYPALDKALGRDGRREYEVAFTKAVACTKNDLLGCVLRLKQGKIT